MQVDAFLFLGANVPPAKAEIAQASFRNGKKVLYRK
jgi:hypothetical protein